MTKFRMWSFRRIGKRRISSINLTITSKSYAHPHTMKKTHAKFHKAKKIKKNMCVSGYMEF